MPPDLLELLKRRIGRLRDQHGSRLVFHESDAIKKIDMARMSTIGAAYEQLLRDTALSLTEYCNQVRAEVLKVVDDAVVGVSLSDRDQILKAVAEQFDGQIYLERFDMFAESIVRHYGRAGRQVDLSRFRLDLFRSRQHAGTVTGINRFLGALSDDLDLVIHTKRATAAYAAETTPRSSVHWTGAWGFWLAVVGTIATVAGTYRAFVPSSPFPTRRDSAAGVRASGAAPTTSQMNVPRASAIVSSPTSTAASRPTRK